MPRSLEEILHHTDELSARFENHDGNPAAVADATALRAVRDDFTERPRAEARLADAVSLARCEGHSWAAIGAMVATSGEAASSATANRYRTAETVSVTNHPESADRSGTSDPARREVRQAMLSHGALNADSTSVRAKSSPLYRSGSPRDRDNAYAKQSPRLSPAGWPLPFPKFR